MHKFSRALRPTYREKYSDFVQYLQGKLLNNQSYFDICDYISTLMLVNIRLKGRFRNFASHSELKPSFIFVNALKLVD